MYNIFLVYINRHSEDYAIFSIICNRIILMNERVRYNELLSFYKFPELNFFSNLNLKKT